MNNWQATGTIKPQELTESRLQLHYAIQFIAATGAALADPLPDDSHTSLAWNPELEVFVGELIQVAKPFRVALEPISLTSIILDKQEDTIATFPLDQKTMTEGLSWLKQEVAKLGADASKIAFLTYPPNDFPDHPLAHGATFDARAEETRQKLTSYYANTHQLLPEIITTTERASSVHIWPHHFDIATLITLPGNKNGSPMTVNIGLSPGDTSYNQPYWYVSPYPYPKTKNLPLLNSEGFWHTQHWVGAVLLASQLSDKAEVARSQVKAFLDSAFKVSQILLMSDEKSV